ncbi:hypothetical protein PPACK8108_LOCUS22601 [Phakopsora pachyrhizi]|uniref:Uncharacterized protein n=1 Tax=Phakopsora pachyrhizi TaxID=170000 RepID=A0AAV0BMP6_PHAPC|nr:hypothetical protein PPACK8108_LOCUS22601 [Phakopsora pachyrhizi]
MASHHDGWELWVADEKLKDELGTAQTTSTSSSPTTLPTTVGELCKKKIWSFQKSSLFGCL